VKTKQIKVGFKTYEVQEGTFKEGQGNMGYHDSMEGIIYIASKDFPNEENVNTLIHELLHALWREYNLDRENEEHYVTVLANGLTRLMQDNPEMFKEMLKDLKQ